MSDIWWSFRKQDMAPADRETLQDFLNRLKKLGHAEYEDRALSPSVKPTTPSAAPEKVAPTDMMIRVGGLYGRKGTTQWADKEDKAYKAVESRYKNHEEFEGDIKHIERYYGELKKKKDSNDDIRRKDLFTLLNNWWGELDRAREYTYTVFQDIKEGAITVPDGWKIIFKEISGNEPNYDEFYKLCPETQEEIINHKKG